MRILPCLATILAGLLAAGCSREVVAGDPGWPDATEEPRGIAAETAAILADYEEVIGEMNRRLREGSGRRLRDLEERVRELPDQWELPARPEAEDPEALDDTDGLLYDSGRGWIEQLNAYRLHQGRPPLETGGTDHDPALAGRGTGVRCTGGVRRDGHHGDGAGQRSAESPGLRGLGGEGAP